MARCTLRYNVLRQSAFFSFFLFFGGGGAMYAIFWMEFRIVGFPERTEGALSYTSPS
jgi:hypothetical protein